jgi:putative transposase
VELVVSDDHAGLRQAIVEGPARRGWRRYYVHFLRNALDYLPRKVDDDCLRELRWLYDRPDLTEAWRDLAAWLAKWQATYPKLCSWVEEHIEETLIFYRLPRQHHKHLKSTNLLERLNEVDQAAHPRRAHLPQRPRACLRLVQALAVEMHENWLEAHRYLKMDDLREHKKVLRMASGGLCRPNVLAYFE